MAPTLMDLLEAHHSQSWGWALACCQWQDSLAEDALQEAYLRVLDGRARFGGKSSEKTWFFGVIKRIAAEQKRSHTRQGLLQVLQRNRAANGGDVAEAADRLLDLDDSCMALRVAMKALSQRQREVLHLVFYGELTLEEAAHTTGMSLGSVRTHYHRGKLRLAELLDRSDER